MRDALVLVLLLLASGRASADLHPEDPYAEAREIDATSGVGPVIRPAVAVAAPQVESAPVDSESELAWYEDSELQLGGGIAAGVLVLGIAIAKRRGRRRPVERRTQFGMSAVDPSRARLGVAAWEHGPAKLPVAIPPAMIAPPRAPIAAPIPPVAPPYPHYSTADRAAYGMPAARSSQPKHVMMPHLHQAPLPGLPAPRGSSHPTLLPAHPPLPREVSPAIPANARLMRLAEGTPPPPCSPQPFTALPTLPAPYPLTFPAFPDAAGSTMLAPIEPSGLSWAPPTDVEVEETQILCARGSQPASSVRRTLKMGTVAIS